jgi:HEAT repeat protein
VLNREQPHFRDIVFEVRPDYKDPYARRLIAEELRANKKDEGVREWCAQLLGIYGDAELAPPLVEALADAHPTVRSAAARSLGELRFEPGAKKLEKVATDKDPFARADAIEARAAIDARTYDATFAAGLKDADAGVCGALLGALPRLYPDRAESASSAMLDDPDWRPRMQAVENLGAVKTKGAVEALVSASGDRRPVVATKATRFLRRLDRQPVLAEVAGTPRDSAARREGRPGLGDEEGLGRALPGGRDAPQPRQAISGRRMAREIRER